MTPRPAILIPVAYGAGLATGLLHFGALGCAVGVSLALAARRRADVACGAAVFGLACGAGALARVTDSKRCAARLPPGVVVLTARLLDTPTGGLIRIEPIDASCVGHIDARWPVREQDRSGTVARITGRWTPRPRVAGRAGGVLAVTSVQSRSFAPRLADRVRAGVVERSRALYGDRASLVDALVLGTRGALDADVRENFARSGLVHLLSISGFHVGLISAWVVLVLRVCGVPRARALAVGALAGGAYVAFLGFPAPAARAGALTCILAIQFARQRRVQADALLACTCLVVLLVDPWAVFDLGGWLSAAALWGATTATRWSDRAFGEGFLSRTLASSVGATLATAPVTAAALGAVAMIGIVLNFAAIPIAALAVPGVLASLLLASVWSSVAEALAAGSGLLLHALELLALTGADAPGGHVIVAEGLPAALPWIALLGVARWTIGRRNTRQEAARRAVVIGCCWAWISLGSALRPAGDARGRLTLHFVDVGQGDGAAIRTPAGEWILVDAGPRGSSFDAGRRILVPFLSRHGVRRLAAVVISHAHLDHLGGAEAVLDRFRADVLVEPASPVPDPVYTALLGTLDALGIRWRAARAGMQFSLDGVRFSLLHPDTTWTGWGADVNEDSAVLRIEYGDFTAVLAGDAGFPAEARMRRRVGRADVLKVGHHGSRGSSSPEWLAELGPSAAIISVGRNRYGHPAPEALERLRRAGADVWRTDVEGTVTITTDGKTMTIRGRRGAVTQSVQ